MTIPERIFPEFSFWTGVCTFFARNTFHGYGNRCTTKKSTCTGWLPVTTVGLRVCAGVGIGVYGQQLFWPKRMKRGQEA